MRPPHLNAPLAPSEQQLFAAAGVDVDAFRAYLRERDLALAVVRDVTTRDDFDLQQPYNFRVAGANHQTIGAPGAIYDLAYLQFFQADQLRGLDFGGAEPRAGRRVLARVLHDPNAMAANLLDPDLAGAAAVAADGSVAFFVPARRALTWQLTDEAGAGVVRERYWADLPARGDSGLWVLSWVE